MSDITLTDKMNEMIKDFLRQSKDPFKLYIFARIEQLEAENSAIHAQTDPSVTANKKVGDNLPLTVEPCWCRDCEHCYTDIDAEDGTKYLRCGNSDSWFAREIVRDKNTCGECKRRNPEEGTRHDD